MRLVAADLGVAIVPESVRALPLDGVVFRDLADGGTIDLALAWRRGTTAINWHSAASSA